LPSGEKGEGRERERGERGRGEREGEVKRDLLFNDKIHSHWLNCSGQGKH
jgi:hypothetical protein